MCSGRTHLRSVGYLMVTVARESAGFCSGLTSEALLRGVFTDNVNVIMNSCNVSRKERRGKTLFFIMGVTTPRWLAMVLTFVT